MAVSREEGIILRAAALSRSSPQDWKAFIEELRKYADHMKDDCVQATPDLLHKMQGRAQLASQLVSLFADAGVTADRISQKAASKV
jgi:hypothetical protein